ncbi:hypothetical protein FHR83_009334 [Actinoplanes campanulatus]|uniref:Carbohydrate-binding module family 96 domain-containing protein n=1 Tax=Actinoplanes campanulatus TaxID=113559 RepID=A0A7W5FKI2_9ACTN|nr:DNRLRE domain-containing protein [Actinoplanes campanulatus]MBB3101605.1 hypothetical protein [Actinoplanes campanulatus]
MPKTPAAAPETYERPDEESARLAAAKTGKDILVTDETSPTALTYTQPDGSLRSEIASVPVRVEQSDGSWADVNYDLHRVAGGWAPKVSPADVVFSAGGDGPAVLLDNGTRGFEMSWATALPEPVIDGNKATYQLTSTQALELVATSDGFEQSLKLSAPPVTAPKQRLGFDLDGLTMVANETGGYDFVKTDADGNATATVVYTMPRPRMYSSLVVDEEHVQSQTVPVSLATDQDGSQYLDLSAGMPFLTNPETVYPVWIDPVVSSTSRYGDTYVSEANNDSHVSDSDLRVGLSSVGNKRRSLIRFNTLSSVPSGKYVSSATLNLYNNASPTCSARSVYAYPITEAYTMTSATWSNQPSYTTSSSYSASASFSHGNEDLGCPNATGAINVTKMVQAWVSGTLTDYGMLVKAGSESDTSYAKSFCAMNLDTTEATSCTTSSRYPTLSVVYTSYSTATVTNRAVESQTLCTTGSARPTVTTTTPGLFAAVTDTVNPEAIISEFEWWAVGGSAKLGSRQSQPVGSEGVTAVSVPADVLSYGQNYKWRVRTNSGTGWSSFGAFCEFHVDYEAPVIDQQSTVPASTCVTGTDRPVLNTTTPTLTATAADADSTTTDITFDVWAVGGTAALKSWTDSAITVGDQTSGIVPTGVLVNGGSYQWRVRGLDNTGRYSDWTTWCEFTVDTSAPTVTSADYPAGRFSGGPGVAGAFTFTPATGADVSSFVYGLDVNPPATAVAASGEISIPITPSTSDSHVLYVRAVNASGVASGVVQYPFSVGTGESGDPSDETATKPEAPADYSMGENTEDTTGDGDVSASAVKRVGSICASKSRTIQPPNGTTGRIWSTANAKMTTYYNKVRGNIYQVDFIDTIGYVHWTGTKPYNATEVTNTVTWSVDYWAGSITVGAKPEGSFNRGSGTVNWTRTISKDDSITLSDDLTRFQVSGTFGDITQVNLVVKGAFSFGNYTYTTSSYASSNINWNWTKAQPYLSKKCS